MKWTRTRPRKEGRYWFRGFGTVKIVTIAIDSPFLGRAFFTKITDYLTAKGYTPTPNVGAGTLTISW